MNSQDYYQEAPDNSEQSLETDVMRFIAMIGIIFWLIFSITSAIPQSAVKKPAEKAPSPASEIKLQPKTVKVEPTPTKTITTEPIKSVKTEKPLKTVTIMPEIKPEPTQPLRPAPIKPTPKPELKTKHELKTKPKRAVPSPVIVPEKQHKKPLPFILKPAENIIEENIKKESIKKPTVINDKAPSKKAKSAFNEPQSAPKTRPHPKVTPQPQPQSQQSQSLSIEFKTLADLLTLLNKKSVTIFCQVKAPGFDLLFRNDRLNRERLPVYSSTTTIPPVLWEIKETKTRRFFLAALQKNFPATGNFPDRKVFVAFADTELEQNIDVRFSRLRNEKRGGTIIISGDGRLDFPEPTKP